MGIIDMARSALTALSGQKPIPVPRDQVQAYIEASRAIVERLRSSSTLYPVEIEFLGAITEHAGNCVLRYNAIVREDIDMEVGCQRLMRSFWNEWDKRFMEIGRQRKMKDDAVALTWQQQLYLLSIFSNINHFHGVVDLWGAPSTDSSLVYCREALEFDLRNELARIIKQEGIVDILLPSLVKAA